MHLRQDRRPSRLLGQLASASQAECQIAHIFYHEMERLNSDLLILRLIDSKLHSKLNIIYPHVALPLEPQLVLTEKLHAQAWSRRTTEPLSDSVIGLGLNDFDAYQG